MISARRWLPPLALLVALLGAASPLGAQVHLRPGVTLRMLEVAAARDSNDPATLYDLALGYWSKNRWDDAERVLDLALTIEPRNAPVRLALAHLPFARRPRLWEEEDTGNVPPEWQPALLKRDRLVQMAFLIDPLVDLQIVGAVAPKESSLLHRRAGASLLQTLTVGFATFRSGQYDQAYAWFDRFARRLGDGTDSARVPGLIYHYRGLAAAHLNDFPSALRDFKAIHAVKPGDEIGLFGIDPVLDTYILAWLEEHQGERDEAIARYQEVLTMDFGVWMAHVQLAHIYEQTQDWVDALRERRLAAEAAPEDPSLLLDLGITQAEAGRLDDAAVSLRAARADLPRNYRVAYYEGVVAQQLGHAADARDAFQRFLSLVPSRFADQIEEVRGRLRALQ